MKKTALTLALIGIATSAFAYSNSDIETATTIINVALIVMAVLQVILFFKIWGMTNDVRLLKEKICPTEMGIYKLDKKVLELQIMGKIDEAKKLVDENLVNDVFYKMFGMGAGNTPVYIKGEVDGVIHKYEKYYKLLGYEMPKEIKNIDVEKVLEQYSTL